MDHVKTPILRPATEALLVGFERLGLMLRIAWLPILIVLVLYAVGFVPLVMSANFDDIGRALERHELTSVRLGWNRGAFMAAYILDMSVLPFAAMLILSCVYVEITKAATRADYAPPRLPFYFALGARELRYFIVRILYALVIFAAAIAALVAGAAVFGVATLLTSAVHGRAAMLVVAPACAAEIAIVLAWLWVVVRFLPALPIAAVENRIAFADAWKMSKGNFWRLLLSGAAFLAMLAALRLVFAIALIAPAALVIAFVAGFGVGVFGPVALAALALIAVALIPAAISLAAFSVAAQAAYPARIYAYLSGCGDACKI